MQQIVVSCGEIEQIYLFSNEMEQICVLWNEKQQIQGTLASNLLPSRFNDLESKYRLFLTCTTQQFIWQVIESSIEES